MFAWIRYRWTLWKLMTEKRAVQKHYAAIYDKGVREKKAQADLRGILEDQFHEVSEVEENITAAISDYLFTLAYRYRVPTPDYSDKRLWEEARHSSRRLLTEKAMAEFRVAIRSEQKERWQILELRLKVGAAVLTGLTGMVGALIGLVAILRK